MAEASSLRGRRILIVEDEYLVAFDLARALEALGAEVLGPAGNVADALQLMQGCRPDVAVLDINLGGEKVYPVADALRAQGTPFVFATGYDNWVIPPAYADTPRCQKPVDIGILARLLPPAAGDGS